MRLHWLQHVPFENAANIGVWAQDRGYVVTHTQLYTDQALPPIEEIDMLAIMGGPMNIYQHRDHPWLLKEKRFIERAVGAGIPMIGVCLGAQLIADVLGAKVTQNPQVEIGWFPVQLTLEGRESRFLGRLPSKFMAFHWHGDTFGIPSGATHLAQSSACSHQAFEYAGNVVGLQFHLEYSAKSIQEMLVHCSNELVQAPFVQSAEQIKDGLTHVESTATLLFSLLDAIDPSQEPS